MRIYKATVTVFIIPPPDNIPTRPPGSTPTPSCQGTVPTCTSHAVAKAVVELLDEKDFDCEQREVITALINVKQSDFTRQWPTAFNGVKPVVQVSHKDEVDNKDWGALHVAVFQSEKLEPKKRNGWKWVIIYKSGWAYI